MPDRRRSSLRRTVCAAFLTAIVLGCRDGSTGTDKPEIGRWDLVLRTEDYIILENVDLENDDNDKRTYFPDAEAFAKHLTGRNVEGTCVVIGLYTSLIGAPTTPSRILELRDLCEKHGAFFAGIRMFPTTPAEACVYRMRLYKSYEEIEDKAERYRRSWDLFNRHRPDAGALGYTYRPRVGVLWYTDLDLAAYSGDARNVRCVLNYGGDVNERGFRNGTALHGAAEFGYLDVVKLLLEAGADPNVVDSEGKTPLDRAIGNGHNEIGQLLREHGARPVAEVKTGGREHAVE